MFRIIKLACVAVAASIQFGCSLFVSSDISEHSIIVNSPKDSAFFNRNEVSFWWEDDQEIEGYRIQIVTPNLDNPSLLLDTMIYGHTYDRIFNNGAFEFQIRGENNGSETAYQSRMFFVDLYSPQVYTTFPSGDTLSQWSNFSFYWASNDPAFPTGEVFPTADSIKIFREAGQTAQLVFEKFMPENSADSTIAPAAVISTPGNYKWLVISTDLAGNRARSDSTYFIIQ